MASGDTKTNQYLDIAANGSRSDLPSSNCCNTRTQGLIIDVAERIMDVEDEVEEMKNNPDVADIVATYADLQAYDTQHLTDKDIIRVLTDETHDGESTYYRYSKSTGAFTYIGTSKQYSDFVGTDGTSAGTSGLVPAPATTDAGKFLKADGTWDTAGGGGSAYNIYSTKTTSSSNTGGAIYLGNLDSSQAQQADPTTTDNHYKYFWALPYNNTAEPVSSSINILGASTGTQSIAIGQNASAIGATNVVIGKAANSGPAGVQQVVVGADAEITGVYGGSVIVGYAGKVQGAEGSVVVGARGNSPKKGCVALGYLSGGSSVLTEAGMVAINSTDTAFGFRSSNYRLLTGLYDGQGDHDAVTVGQVNSVIDNINSALNTNIPHIGA